MEEILKTQGSPVQLYLLLGEAEVHLGNLLDDDEDDLESISHYKKAVEYFQKVQDLDKDALPEQFEEFLIEWKTDMES
jgi:DNA-directed RNA polymerase subunit F